MIQIVCNIVYFYYVFMKIISTEAEFNILVTLPNYEKDNTQFSHKICSYYYHKKKKYLLVQFRYMIT